MLTFKNLGKLGRLGNQLFQIASTIGIAKNNDVNYCFFHWEYQDFFCKSLPYMNIDVDQKLMEGNKHDYRKVTLSEDPEFFLGKKYDLLGYLQSHKYFENYKEEILSYFQLKQEHVDYIKNKYTECENQISIHVRRTDYVALRHYHTLLDMDYYKKAIDLIGKEESFLIFSDDIEWCRQNFKDYNCQYVEERPHDKNIISGVEDTGMVGMMSMKEVDSLKYKKEDVIELFLMSMCKHNIVANSSFSWWAAYLNKNKEKKIICPRDWFTEVRVKQTYVDVENYMKHRVPEDWIPV